MDKPTEPSFELGILTHAAALGRYARLLTRSPERAEDLVQDCLARALSRVHLYEPGTNLRAWLFTILHNIAMTEGRKLKYRQAYIAERTEMGATATAPNQIHRVALIESLRLIKRLPAREQQAVALVGILGMTYEEAARHSGMAIGTMKSRLSRGQARLRALAEPLPEAA
jgi:RNA polymerase sigma-70 factor (ECF subfamily)